MRPLPDSPDKRVASPYHGLTSVFHLIELADEVSWEPAATFGLSCVGQGLEQLPLEENLAWKAAQAFAAATRSELPALRIHIEKHIPSGAGLGGGSADAAAVLALFWNVTKGTVPFAVLQQLASSLGADVAFFLAESAACLMGGIGDKLLATLRPAAGVPVVIVWDQAALVSTPQVYAAFDRSPLPLDLVGEAALVAALSECNSTPGPLPSSQGVADIELVAPHLYNNLSAAAFAVSPAAQRVHTFVHDAPQAQAAALSGSGGASFALCASADDAQVLAQRARAEGFAAQATKLAGQTLGTQLASEQEVGKR
ncbi:MAG: hypothetical protein FWC54_03610 [Actinomycetia bacterium]|nr:hypothetical protein [Actinomycetes bacterium]